MQQRRAVRISTTGDICDIINLRYRSYELRIESFISEASRSLALPAREPPIMPPIMLPATMPSGPKLAPTAAPIFAPKNAPPHPPTGLLLLFL